MNRTVSFIKNTASTALLQMITLLSGFFIPRIMIGVYGSEINGLISSITQFISYFNILESGISAAAIWSLYKPLIAKDNKTISIIVVTMKNFYNKVGYIFVSLTLGLAIIYPAFIKVQALSYFEVFLLVLILGVSGALEFFTLAKYRALLTADKKTYVISLASICAICLNVIIVSVLAYLKFNIVLVKFIALLSIFFRTVILKLYVNKNYPFIDYAVNSDFSKLDKHWDAMISQCLSIIQSAGPIVLVTLIADLKTVSIYAVYNLVINGINSILSIFTRGLSSFFGEIIVRNEKDILKRIYNQFELSYYILITVVYAVSFIMIMPFIRIYTKNIADINYDIPVLGFLMVLNGVLYNIKTPQETMIVAAGWYKEIKKQAIIQALIVVIVGYICGYYFGIIGVLIGSLVANLYRDIDFIILVPKYLIGIDYKKTAFRVILVLSLTIVLYLPFALVRMNIDNIIEWCLYSLVILCYAFLVTLIVMFFIDKGTLVEVIKRINGVRNGRKI